MAADSLRRSPLDDRHRQLGATMTEFGGWDMPLDYGSVVAEHQAVREGAGVFDLSHLGTVMITGSGAEAALQRALTNDVTKLEVGRAHYTLCLNDRAGIIDDLLLYRFEWGYFAVPNAANTAAVLSAITDAAGEDVVVDDVTADLACIAVQGPQATDLVTAAGVDVAGMEYLDVRPLPVATAEDTDGDALPTSPVPGGGILSRTGYTGETGYELFYPAAQAGPVWDRITAAGAIPAGLGCRDTLRLEMGYPLHGNEISAERTPVGVRLGFAIKAGTGFRGEDAYSAAKEAGAKANVWGLRVTGRGIPREGYTVRSGEKDVGTVLSGTFSPTLKIGIATAMLDTTVSPGDQVTIDVRGKPVPAEVVRPPFVDTSPKA